MKRFGWGFGSSLAGTLLAVVSMMHPAPAIAQGSNASVHGHVQNPLGIAVTTGEVRLTTDRSNGDLASHKADYTFPVDATGNYKGADIKPATYIVMFVQNKKAVDFHTDVIFKAAEDHLVDFDMTRKEYMDSLSPEDKKNLEEYKTKNAAATKANSQVAHLNTLLAQARAANKAGNYDEAITAMQEATTAKADVGILWLTLGDAQLGAADKAAKAAGKPSTDPSVAPKYNDAVTSYKKAIDLNTAATKPSPEVAGAAQNQLGTVYAKMGDAQNSTLAFDAAVKAQPANAGTYYYNEAATFYNASKLDDANAAADKAIAADPQKADAFYLKGQALIPKASVDPKTQKITAPPGCIEAYQQYLALAPTGSHAQEVKDILAGIGATVQSTYKAPKANGKK